MNELIFNNEEFGEIRTTIIEGEPWFCLADVCRALEIKNPADMKKRLNQKDIDTIDTLTTGGFLCSSLDYFHYPHCSVPRIISV